MKKLPKNKTILSVVVLNYNAGQYLPDCLKSIYNSDLQHSLEVIVVDNASTDNSIELAKLVKNSNQLVNTKFLVLDTNLGFAAGNNRGISLVSPSSEYILFLNPDTVVNPDTIEGMINYFTNHPRIDAATCNIIFAQTGLTQPECHRGFPNPWNTFCHFFLPFMPKLFPHSKFFNGYYLGHLDYTKVQKIDCCVGAFFMLKKSVGQAVGWWNEKYFFYGEDIDFCYQLRQHKFSLYFIPNYQITHYQGISSGIKKAKSAASRQTKVRSAIASTNAMRIFYQENLIKNYPKPFHPFIYIGINLLKTYRVFRAKYL